MCDECRQYRCTCGCPNYNDGGGVRCDFCGSLITAEKPRLRTERGSICADCAGQLSLGEIFSNCGVFDVSDMREALSSQLVLKKSENICSPMPII